MQKVYVLTGRDKEFIGVYLTWGGAEDEIEKWLDKYEDFSEDDFFIQETRVKP